MCILHFYDNYRNCTFSQLNCVFSLRHFPGQCMVDSPSTQTLAILHTPPSQTETHFSWLILLTNLHVPLACLNSCYCTETNALFPLCVRGNRSQTCNHNNTFHISPELTLLGCGEVLSNPSDNSESFTITDSSRDLLCLELWRRMLFLRLLFLLESLLFNFGFSWNTNDNHYSIQGCKRDITETYNATSSPMDSMSHLQLGQCFGLNTHTPSHKRLLGLSRPPTTYLGFAVELLTFL